MAYDDLSSIINVGQHIKVPYMNTELSQNY